MEGDGIMEDNKNDHKEQNEQIKELGSDISKTSKGNIYTLCAKN